MMCGSREHVRREEGEVNGPAHDQDIDLAALFDLFIGMQVAMLH